MPSKELSGSAKVTAFSFMRRREKGITGKGMENEYEENLRSAFTGPLRPETASPMETNSPR